MRVFVYREPSGRVWADYSPQAIRTDRQPLAEYEAHTRAEIEALIGNPGDLVPERVKALAERALKELLARSQAPDPVITLTPLLINVRDRGFFGRLKWLVMGK